jgi:hypothetical protein
MVDINVHFTGAPHPFYRVSPWLDLVAPEKDFSPKAIGEKFSPCSCCAIFGKRVRRILFLRVLD